MKMRTLLFLFVLGSVAVAQEQSPSLGDVARRKPAKKATRVITNDEIPSKPEPPAEPKTELKTDASSIKTSDASKQPDGDPTLPEPVRTAEKNLGAIRGEHAKVESDIRDLQTRIAEATDSRVKDALTAQLEDKKQNEVDLKKKVAEADEQVTAARKAAGLPTGPAW